MFLVRLIYASKISSAFEIEHVKDIVEKVGTISGNWHTHLIIDSEEKWNFKNVK